MIMENVVDKEKYFVHESSYIDETVEIGEGTKIWHFSHIQSGARIGKNCSIGQNVNVGNNVIIGNNVKIQNNVSLYEGVELEDYVFKYEGNKLYWAFEQSCYTEKHMKCIKETTVDCFPWGNELLCDCIEYRETKINHCNWDDAIPGPLLRELIKKCH